jgi:hypothetical protein
MVVLICAVRPQLAQLQDEALRAAGSWAAEKARYAKGLETLQSERFIHAPAFTPPGPGRGRKVSNPFESFIHAPAFLNKEGRG